MTELEQAREELRKAAEDRTLHWRRWEESVDRFIAAEDAFYAAEQRDAERDPGPA